MFARQLKTIAEFHLWGMQDGVKGIAGKLFDELART